MAHFHPSSQATRYAKFYSLFTIALSLIVLALLFWGALSPHLSAKATAPAVPAACTALGFGQSISETIAIAGEVDCFTLTGNTNDQILARVIKTTGSLGPVIEVFAPDGTNLCRTILGELTCALTANGLHKISVKDFGGPNTGDYRIYLQRLNTPVGCTAVSFGALPASGSIELAGDVSCFTFAGATTDQVRVRVVKTVGDLSPVIKIFRPVGANVCSTILGELDCQLDATGSHTILVKDFGGPNTGVYHLHIQRLNDAVNCTPIAFDAPPLSAAIDAPAEMDCYPFQAVAGANVRARVITTEGNLSPVLEIARPNGTRLCRTILGELSCLLDATGLHTVLVKDFAGPNAGAYQVSLSCLSATCGSTPPQPTSTPTPTVTSTVTPTATAMPTATQPCPPGIAFTSIPPYNARDLLHGKVTCVNPTEHRVAVYIYQEGWWTKPRFGAGLTPIQAGGTWTTEIVTGGYDECATSIAAFLLQKGDLAEELSGAPELPPALLQRALAQATTQRHYPRSIAFAGRTWYVKTCAGKLGPGPNLFSDHLDDVYVDANGQLHMRIAQRDGKWYASEVVAADSLGYGTYIFNLASRVDQLDKNVVLGLFTWDTHAPQFNHRELDIEFSRWGEDNAPNAQFVVQPFNVPDHRHRFHLALTSEQSTHRLIWQPGRVDFASFRGMSQSPGDLIEAWTRQHHDIPPAGGETPRINLWLLNGQPPSNGQEVEVIIKSFTFVSSSPVITSVRPNQGRGDITNEIHLLGANFVTGTQVNLGVTPLTATFIDSTHLQAIVPAGMAPGVYGITVVNPDGKRSTLPDSYSVVDPVNNDDLFGVDYELWLDPASPHAGSLAKLYLVVHRSGGKNTLSEVKVRFDIRLPNNGSTPIGEGAIPLLSPNGSATTTVVTWTALTAGNYPIYALIDPANAVSESNEQNNVVYRNITVLPPATDEVAPHVDSFTINDGATSTSERTVRLNITASDTPTTGNVAKLFFVEYVYSEAAGLWVPIQQSAWLDYVTSRTNYPWLLSPTGGLKMLHVWAADATGNISLFPYKQAINYLPASQHVALNQRQIYRLDLQAGQPLNARLTPLNGDPDLYIWPPDHVTRPPWVSNLARDVDDLMLVAPLAGVYQIEVYGFSAADYQLTFTAGSDIAMAQVNGGEDPAKAKLTQPLLSNTATPSEQFGLPVPAEGVYLNFLPMIRR